MNLKKITVKKLFGLFDHEIALNSSGITIIIGENGLGKTKLLEMIEAFFNKKFNYFEDVKFSEIIFEFSDNVSWILKKVESEEMEFELQLIPIYPKTKKVSSYKSFTIHKYRRHKGNIILNRKFLKERFFELQDQKHIFLNSDSDLYYQYNYLKESELLDVKAPKWFLDRHEVITVNLIETQRLFVEDKNEKTHIKTVEKYSTELSNAIKTLLTESTELSSKLDRTYPNRLINRLKSPTDATAVIINENFKLLEDKRKLLDTVGLIEIDKNLNNFEIQDNENVLADVLMLYVEDSFEKIKIFDGISKKIQLFLDIINKRFKHKKLFIDKEKGFMLKSTVVKDSKGNYEQIPVSKLSSGEQNELVLFYLLIFKSESKSLILIDEPEVSLHISWQNSFIDDLKDIITLNDLNAVIATHSPDIIANNWDLKIELRGVE